MNLDVIAILVRYSTECLTDGVVPSLLFPTFTSLTQPNFSPILSHPIPSHPLNPLIHNFLSQADKHSTILDFLLPSSRLISSQPNHPLIYLPQLPPRLITSSTSLIHKPGSRTGTRSTFNMPHHSPTHSLMNRNILVLVLPSAKVHTID